MKNIIHLLNPKTTMLFMLLSITFFVFPAYSQNETSDFTAYSGTIIDAQTKEPLIFASISLVGTNISTITNNEGKFSLKVPTSTSSTTVLISFLGYQQQNIALDELKKTKNKIELTPIITELKETNVNIFKDPKELVKETLKRKGNNQDKQTLMTAFYRETIKKRNKNVSLAEAIVSVYKEPYNTFKSDRVKLYKARKSTDYSRLDTVALKLQGGPFNALYIDLMKYPEYLFTSEMLEYYNFSYAPSTTINGNIVFVVKFAQKSEVNEPLYYGKLFIDAQSLALNSAIYNLNVENKLLAGSMFVKKKPRNISVYPTKAGYRVDYLEKDGKWYYNYSNAQLSFKVNRKGKLFNSTYSLSSEMAVTDWKINDIKENIKVKERIRPSIIIADEASGFSDPEFWGSYNVIEPEKSIESAINKIKRQLKKARKS